MPNHLAGNRRQTDGLIFLSDHGIAQIDFVKRLHVSGVILRVLWNLAPMWGVREKEIFQQDDFVVFSKLTVKTTPGKVHHDLPIVDFSILIRSWTTGYERGLHPGRVFREPINEEEKKGREIRPSPPTTCLFFLHRV